MIEMASALLLLSFAGKPVIRDHSFPAARGIMRQAAEFVLAM